MQKSQEVRQRPEILLPAETQNTVLEINTQSKSAGRLKWDGSTLRAALIPKSVQEVVVEHCTCQSKNQ